MPPFQWRTGELGAPGTERWTRFRFARPHTGSLDAPGHAGWPCGELSLQKCYRTVRDWVALHMLLALPSVAPLSIVSYTFIYSKWRGEHEEFLEVANLGFRDLQKGEVKDKGESAFGQKMAFLNLVSE